jgi:putative membrane protein insertion efficiency factor
LDIDRFDQRQAQQSDIEDPRSPYYLRKLNRPAISRWRVVLLYALPVAILIALGVLLPQPWNWWGMGGYSLFHLLLALKASCIQAVLLYQHFAPERIRRKCRFEPSCSEYMLLSLKKYGPIRGLFKGISRLRRCHLQQGGYDFP